jgi:hypothetical protein
LIKKFAKQSTNIDNMQLSAESGKPDIITGGITTFCEGDKVQLSSSVGFSWLWSNGETTRIIYAKTTGSYTVNVIDEFGWDSPTVRMKPL